MGIADLRQCEWIIWKSTFSFIHYFLLLWSKWRHHRRSKTQSAIDSLILSDYKIPNMHKVNSNISWCTSQQQTTNTFFWHACSLFYYFITSLLYVSYVYISQTHHSLLPGLKAWNKFSSNIYSISHKETFCCHLKTDHCAQSYSCN